MEDTRLTRTELLALAGCVRLAIVTDMLSPDARRVVEAALAKLARLHAASAGGPHRSRLN